MHWIGKNRLLCVAILLGVNLASFYAMRASDFLGADAMQVLLLGDTALVGMYYAALTGHIARSAQLQAGLTERLSKSAATQSRFLARQAKKAATPQVVLQVKDNGDGNFHYVCRNLGTGGALNVVWLEGNTEQPAYLTHLGSLAPGEERRVPDAVEKRLNLVSQNLGPMESRRHIVLAQAVENVGGKIGDVEWLAIEHRVENGNRVSNRPIGFNVSVELLERIFPPSVAEFMDSI